MNRFLDDDYYTLRDYQLEDIEVPLLSVANWGGITLHLRGNVEGYNWAGSKNKWLRFITGRHDLPFYYAEEVEIQRGFLDCFLKDDDWAGWLPGRQPKVSVRLRKGNKGINDAAREKEWEQRSEEEWPIARTEYVKFHLTPDKRMQQDLWQGDPATLTYKALGTLQDQQSLQFHSGPFEAETEITGHITAHLNLSVSGNSDGEAQAPSELDVFLTLRYLDTDGNEIFYTGAAGDPVPLSKGWLRLSLRSVDESHTQHRHYLPRRNYRSEDVLPVEPDRVYTVAVEVWPTNVVVERGGRIILEVASGDTQGAGLFTHDNPVDRDPARLAGLNHLHFGPDHANYVTLPFIPPK